MQSRISLVSNTLYNDISTNKDSSIYIYKEYLMNYLLRLDVSHATDWFPIVYNHILPSYIYSFDKLIHYFTILNAKYLDSHYYIK